MTPDPWEATVLRSSADRVLLGCSRQAGKSTTAAALALREALCRPPALVLLLSPTLRQSGELFRIGVRRLYEAMARPVPVASETALTMELANGSRIVALPGEESNVRGYSGVRLLVIDEAARVPDSLYHAMRPTLAVSGGRLVCLSSAYAPQGFFYEAWANGGPGWQRIKITADQCPRISEDFLAEEREALGTRIYEREYMFVFTGSDDAVFDPLTIDRALAAEGSGAPLF
jgi:hypothetical protein